MEARDIEQWSGAQNACLALTKVPWFNLEHPLRLGGIILESSRQEDQEFKVILDQFKANLGCRRLHLKKPSKYKREQIEVGAVNTQM